MAEDEEEVKNLLQSQVKTHTSEIEQRLVTLEQAFLNSQAKPKRHSRKAETDSETPIARRKGKKIEQSEPETDASLKNLKINISELRKKMMN